MPTQLNWSASFSKEKTWPYGSKIFFEQLDQLFPNQEIYTSDSPIFNTLVDSVSGIYLSISDMFTADDLDVDKFLEFISKGNTAFLSSENFNSDFLDPLNLTQAYEFKTDQLESLSDDDTSLNLRFANSQLNPNRSYKMKSVRFYRHFESLFDSIPLLALGYIESDKVCFTKIPFGEGQIYLHSFPYAFSNYHMLREHNSEYVSNCLSYLPDSPLIWDEYYKLDRRNRQESPLKTILQSRSFKWAYWIGITSLFLFMLFKIKRKQAAIPVLEAFKNESLKFTRTIGDLYFEKGNNHGLAMKKISVLKEFIHRKYLVQNIRFEFKEIQSISIKSGKDLNFVRELWAYIQDIKKLKILNDQQLKRLSTMLNLFYGRDHH
jgi:hypothetical protein